MQGKRDTIRQRTLVRACTELAWTGLGDKETILWNKQLQTDSTIPNNKPDIIIRDNGKRIWKLIDIAISGDINVDQERSQADSKT
jgi:hypothetical protein